MRGLSGGDWPGGGQREREIALAQLARGVVACGVLLVMLCSTGARAFAGADEGACGPDTGQAPVGAPQPLKPGGGSELSAPGASPEGDSASRIEAPEGAAEREGSEENVFRGPPQEPEFRFDLYQRYKLRADLDKGGASVAVSRAGGSATSSKWFGYIRMSLGAGVERSEYHLSRGEFINSPPDPPTASDPWSEVGIVRLNLSLLVPLGRSNWSVFALGGVKFGGERGTELDQGISSSFILALGYRIDETLTLQVGFGLVTRIVGDPFGFPLIGVRWKPTEWFRLETRGPGIEAGVKPIEELEFTAGARFDNRQYRLEDKRRLLAKHVVEDQEIQVDFGAIWQPLPAFSLRGTVGVVAYQEFEIRDKRGDTRYRSRTDPAPYFELRVALDF